MRTEGHKLGVVHIPTDTIPHIFCNQWPIYMCDYKSLSWRRTVYFQKGHIKIIKIAKFDGEMVQNAENMGFMALKKVHPPIMLTQIITLTLNLLCVDILNIKN